jgi:hypothetical protein
LVIGSLCPDAGYCLGTSHLAKFSHQPLAGALGFCLPLSLLLVTLFYLFRRQVMELLPRRYQSVLDQLRLSRAASPLVVAYSSLAGIWTHILLDSITHRDGLFAGDIAVLHERIQILHHPFLISDIAYALATFFGAAYVGLAWLKSLEQTAGTSTWAFAGCKWFVALTLGAMTLLLSLANHSMSSKVVLAAIGVATCILILVFFESSLWLLRAGNRRGAKAGLRDRTKVSARGLKSHSNSTHQTAIGAKTE